jgi:LPXTG-motif cell wall-anchored protein
MSFVSETEAWVVSDNRLAHTTDGENWTELAVPGAFPWLSLRLMGPYLSDVQFIDKDHGWIVGTEIPVMYTPDGGANWYRQGVPSTVADTIAPIMAICCIDQTHGWAVGWNGVIMRTTSGDSLGPRLWGGSADVLILSAIGAVVVLVVGGVIVFRRRRRKPIASAPGVNPALLEIA